MQTIRDLIRQYFEKVQPLSAGLHTYHSSPDTQVPYRLHLRLEKDGSGLLIINARTILHLNQTASEYAYHLVNRTPWETMVRSLTSRYNVKAEVVEKDYHNLVEKIDTLIQSEDLDPVTYLGLERITPYSELSAPLRLDCALTYHLSDGAEDAAPTDRVKRELVTEEWKTILSKAWQAGIPHVTFTGGEPTLRPDLIDLIGYAQNLGLVCGLLTDGLRLTDTHFLQALLQSGLDHLVISLDPSQEYTWEAIRDILPEDIQLTVHFTLTPSTQTTAEETIQKLVQMGVKTVSLSTSEVSLTEKLHYLRQYLAENNINLAWDLPVPYSSLNPVALETKSSLDEMQGAGKAWLYVEPDGDVLPAQGINQPLGNLLTQPWEEIWKP